MSAGLLIQAAVGSLGGTGGWRTNRSGVLGVGGVEHGATGGVELRCVAVVDGSPTTIVRSASMMELALGPLYSEDAFS